MIRLAADNDRLAVERSAAGSPASSRNHQGGITWARSQPETATEIFYKDWGKGQPIVFSHGWPLSADDWDAQMLFFRKHRLSRHSS
jgi:non-heme chloroperoxidase